MTAIRLPSPLSARSSAWPPRCRRAGVAALLATVLAVSAARAAPLSVHPLQDPYADPARTVASPPPPPAATVPVRAAVVPSQVIAPSMTAPQVMPAQIVPPPVMSMQVRPPQVTAPAAAPRAGAAADTGPGGAAPAADAARAYRIGFGDELNFRFVHVPELNTLATVRSDGTVSLPMLGEWRVAGATLRELALRVQTALAGRVTRPDVVINVQGSPPSQRVFIGGEVVKPGVQPLAGALTVLQAVMGADGLKDTAQPREVTVLRAGTDGVPQQLRVDLQALMAGEPGARDLALAAQDIVVVPRSGIANVGLWVDQYIRRVIPVSLGVGYSFGRGSATP